MACQRPIDPSRGTVAESSPGFPAATGVRANRAKGIEQGQPLPHAQRLGPTIRRDPRGPEGGVNVLRRYRQLAGQDVVQHLSPLAERRLDESPELILALRVEAILGRRVGE